MLKRVGSKKKITSLSNTSSDAPTASSAKENRRVRSRSIQRVPSSNEKAMNESIAASDDPEKLVKAAVAARSGGRFFGRRRGSTGGATGFMTTSKKDSSENRAPSRPRMRRHHSSDLGSGGNGIEYREVMVNGKKKMVRVKKKSAAEAAAEESEGGGRKLVKVKVKQVKKHSNNQSSNSSYHLAPNSVPIQVSIAPNHQLRKPTAPARQSVSDNISGVWSKAARSLFSFGGDRRSRASSGNEEEVDMAFDPEHEQQSEINDGKSSVSRSHTKSSVAYKPPTQLNGEPGVENKSKSEDEAEHAEQPPPEAAPNATKPKKKVRSEFFEKYADEEEEDGFVPPVLEVNTNMNMSRTKTKSIYQSESMIRRQFIQDQWLSMGSNYVVWEQAAVGKNDASSSSKDNGYKSVAVDYADDVSEISGEDLAPEMLLEVKPQNELDQWEAICTDRIDRYGAKSARTAESFVNRGIAQLKSGRLDDAADSLLSAVCFLEEVHGSIDHMKLQNNGCSPAHMHMAQAFFMLGKVYMEQQQYPMAESALHKALNIRQQNLGKAHPDTVDCWEQLGISYVQRAAQLQDDAETELFLQRQAMEILTQVLKLKRAIFGSIHVAVAHTARMVAKLCALRNEMERAQRLYKQVMNVLTQIDKDSTSCINPDFPDPRDIAARGKRKRELTEIEEEMRRFGLKEEILEI